MGVYTKTGDKGMTSLYTGERVAKNSLRVDCYGTIDEMNSALAMARAMAKNTEVQEKVKLLQKEVSLLMADFASIEAEPMIKAENICRLEKAMDDMEARLPKLNHFIVPGDTCAGACLDLARTTARRAERRALDLADQDAVAESDRIFLNRISDYCFLLMRLEDEL